jgi:hypothetical protein
MLQLPLVFSHVQSLRWACCMLHLLSFVDDNTVLSVCRERLRCTYYWNIGKAANHNRICHASVQPRVSGSWYASYNIYSLFIAFFSSHVPYLLFSKSSQICISLSCHSCCHWYTTSDWLLQLNCIPAPYFGASMVSGQKTNSPDWGLRWFLLVVPSKIRIIL